MSSSRLPTSLSNWTTTCTSSYDALHESNHLAPRSARWRNRARRLRPALQLRLLFRRSGSSSSSPIRLGIASYTFRKFDQAHLIEFMKQLNCTLLNLKDVHLPMTPADQVASRAAEYRAAGLTLTADGTIYFDKDDDDDIRAKFDYVKAAGIPMIVGAPTRQVLPRVEKFVKEYDIKLAIHNHGPEDKQWPSPLDVLAAVR